MKKLISVFLTLCMVLSMLVLPTFAAEYKNLDGITALPAYAAGVELTKTEYKVSDMSVVKAWVDADQTFSGKVLYLSENVTYTGTIGDDTHPFAGTFDGNGNSITLTQTAGTGLFAYTNGATIQNLTIAQGSSINNNANTGTGAIVGNATNTKLIGVVSYANITDTFTTSVVSNVGGLVGQASGTLTISACANYGTIVGGTDEVGGIVGKTNSGTVLIENTINHGEVSGGQDVAGFVGLNGATIEINGSANYGDITGTTKWVGGMIGRSTGSTKITNTTNEGTITGSGFCNGGMIGRATAGATLENCKNYGAISGTYQCAGMIGLAEGAYAYKVTGCMNDGDVTGTSHSGAGIIGYVSATGKLTISDTVNSGDIKSTQDTGGFVGLHNAAATDGVHFINCANSGNVTQTATNSWTGGLLARSGKGSTHVTATNCKNYGDISGKGDMGGILGRVVGGCTATGCINFGTITASIGSYDVNNTSAGIVGRVQAASTITNCTNYGMVTCKNGVQDAGSGVAAILGASQANHETATVVFTKNENYGSIIGKTNNTSGEWDKKMVCGWNSSCYPVNTDYNSSTYEGRCLDKSSYTTHLIGYQMTEIYNNGEEDVQDIRFVATIDSLNYSEVGFKITVKNTNGEAIAYFEDASDYVYTELLAVESEGDILADNYRKGGYFFALSITGVTAGNYIFEVETYAKDMDGDAVTTSCDTKTTSAITFGDLGN